MSRTAHSIGRLYCVFGAAQGGGAPLVDSCSTSERDGQRRRGRGILIRPPFMGGKSHDLGLVLGIWGKPGSAEAFERPSSGPGYGEVPTLTDELRR